MTDNYFTALAGIDVSAHVEKKGDFDYLSWAFAVHALKTAYPDAYWEVKRFDGLPFLATSCGVFVEVEVSIPLETSTETLSQIHPVLDARNRPIEKPNAFQINTSIQRCLVKAIALHGLGLNLYAGEDLPIHVDAVFHEPESEENPKDEGVAIPLRELAKPKTEDVPSVVSVPLPADGTHYQSQEQVDALVVLANQTKTPIQNILDHFGVKKLSQLPPDKYSKTMRSLARKLPQETEH